MTIDKIVDEIGRLLKIERTQETGGDQWWKRPSSREFTEYLVCWSRQTKQSPAEIINGIAEYIARAFHEGKITFLFGDAVANTLFHPIMDLKFQPVPDETDTSLAWNVYLAFDEGEYNPLETSTIPMIAEMVKKLDAK